MRSITFWLLRLYLVCASTIVFAAEHGGEAKSEGGATSEYMELKPALITNYGGPGPIHFLKAEITLRLSKTAEANEAVVHHMPRIRHELIMLLTRQNSTNLESMQGKEQLRQDALTTVQKLLEAETGKKNIEDLLFTNFVIQS